MAWYTPFIIPAILNTPQLLRSGNVGQFVQNTGVQGATNTAIGNIAPNFNMNPQPSYVPGFNPPVASNIAGNLVGPQSAQQGLLSGAGAYAGPTSMMQANLGSNLSAPLDMSSNIMPSYMDTSTMPNLTARTDVPQVSTFNLGPDMGQTIKPEVTDIAQAGGYEEKPLYQKAFDKISQYVEDKPLEAALLGITGAGAIYEGLKGPERPAPQPTLGPKLGGGQVNMGAPLQVFRQRRRGR